MSCYVTEDVYSLTKSTLLYAACEALVKVIAEHGNVLIVENEEKVRFPVLRSLVTDNPISDIKTTTPPLTKTVSATPRRKRAIPPGPNNLFNS